MGSRGSVIPFLEGKISRSAYNRFCNDASIFRLVRVSIGYVGIGKCPRGELFVPEF